MRSVLLWLAMVAVCFFSYSPAVHAEWNYGIGTGLFRLNAQGDEGFNTNLAGPVKIKLDMSPQDFSDMTESAFGFGGYATDGTWLIKYSLSHLALHDSGSYGQPDGDRVSGKLDYDTFVGEVLAGYPLVVRDAYTLRAEGGVRYIRHDIKMTLDITPAGAGTTRVTDEINEGWLDPVLGLSLDVPLAKKWNWNTFANVGYGGSDGTYSAGTGVTWRFLEHWSTSLYGKYTAIKYEKGKRGDSNWYLYDVDEFGLGLGVMYNW